MQKVQIIPLHKDGEMEYEVDKTSNAQVQTAHLIYTKFSISKDGVMRKKLAFLDTSLDDYAHFQNRLDRKLAINSTGSNRVKPIRLETFFNYRTWCARDRTRDADGIYRVMYVAKFEEGFTYCIVFKRKHRLPVNRILFSQTTL